MTWYLTPSALSIIETIRDDPPKCIERHCFYGAKREEWYEWVGEAVEALRAVRSAILDPALAAADVSGDYARYTALAHGSVDDVICAATGLRLPGKTLVTDVERRAEIAAAIDAALALGEPVGRRAAA